MVNEKSLRKLLVYGGNYGARLLGNLGDVTFKYTPLLNPDKTDKIGYKLGHPFSAMGFAAWDFAFENIPYLKNAEWSKTANILAKAGGTLYFGFLTGKNLIDFALGNYTEAGQLPFNASMAASLGKDLKDLFP
jgi:hypothetical protein